ncbi:endonuclease [Ureibacillus chungkukjangi]|uniref:Uncharacterized protein n=1 Tax=Ureibacillus chungkukjangi TaxID=1202712 RepID=A0A318U4Q8_9BACL|nr:endonuclease [Ureibacillus chungkukjangi]MCM3389032.1 endonuclease [Ureibacillus chungkukjangi]PYF06899.1 hypothetical protein BJ095_107135 [Ureibacillus chungkukjangi]
MQRIQMLISQLECIDQIMTAKIENERAQIHSQIFSQLGTTYQKVSLAEKQFHVKNACSPNTSVNNEILVHLKEEI